MTSKSPRVAPRPTEPRPRHGAIDRWFGVSRRKSTMGAEVRGGLVTFFTMAYIIALNPLIIGTGADRDGNLVSGLPLIDPATGEVSGANVGTTIGMVAAATAFVAAAMTIFMGVFGRFPLGLATGLGLNALVAYVIAKQMTWPQAMGLIFWEGVLILVLVLTGFRQAVFKAVPTSLRTGIAVGIGLFVTFVGLVDAGIVRRPASPTAPPVELGHLGNLFGWPALVFVIGLALLVGLYAKQVKGAMLIAILGTSVIAGLLQLVVKNPAMRPDSDTYNPTGWALNVPGLKEGVPVFSLPDLGLLGRVDPFGAFSGGPTVVLGVLLTIFALLLADFFDTMGTIVAVGSEGGILDRNGNPPHLREILIVDSVAAMAGGLGSVSSNTSYIESAAGVGEGARTGLASVVTGAMFFLAMFLSPLVNLVPSEAVAPVLVFVGFLMMMQVGDVSWDDLEEGLPAFLTMILMPLTYSITNGIGAGFVCYVFLKLVSGKARQVHPLLYVVGAAFLLYFSQAVVSSLL